MPYKACVFRNISLVKRRKDANAKIKEQKLADAEMKSQRLVNIEVVSHWLAKIVRGQKQRSDLESKSEDLRLQG